MLCRHVLTVDRLVEDAHSSSSSSQQPHNTDNDDDDHDSFEQLFEQLRLMKGHSPTHSLAAAVLRSATLVAVEMCRRGEV